MATRTYGHDRDDDRNHTHVGRGVSNDVHTYREGKMKATKNSVKDIIAIFRKLK
jgi:hypothetical protein